MFEFSPIESRWKNLSPAEVLEVLRKPSPLGDTELAEVLSEGVIAPAPIEPSIYLESSDNNTLVIRAGTRNKEYWKYIIEFQQDGADTITRGKAVNSKGRRMGFGEKWPGDAAAMRRILKDTHREIGK